jgi:hypothetical protein
MNLNPYIDPKVPVSATLFHKILKISAIIVFVGYLLDLLQVVLFLLLGKVTLQSSILAAVPGSGASLYGMTVWVWLYIPASISTLFFLLRFIILNKKPFWINTTNVPRNLGLTMAIVIIVAFNVCLICYTLFLGTERILH